MHLQQFLDSADIADSDRYLYVQFLPEASQASMNGGAVVLVGSHQCSKLDESRGDAGNFGSYMLVDRGATIEVLNDAHEGIEAGALLIDDTLLR